MSVIVKFKPTTSSSLGKNKTVFELLKKEYSNRFSKFINVDTLLELFDQF